MREERARAPVWATCVRAAPCFFHGGLKPGLRVVVTRLLGGLHHGRAELRVVVTRLLGTVGRRGRSRSQIAARRRLPQARGAEIAICRSPPQLARGLLPTTSVVAAHEINSEWMALYGSRLTPQSFELGCLAV